MQKKRTLFSSIKKAVQLCAKKKRISRAFNVSRESIFVFSGGNSSLEMRNIKKTSKLFSILSFTIKKKDQDSAGGDPTDSGHLIDDWV